VQAVNFHDLNAEQLEPSEQSLQCGLIAERTVDQRSGRFHGCDQVLEVKQRSGGSVPVMRLS
jgi:hypothetical protein